MMNGRHAAMAVIFLGLALLAVVAFGQTAAPGAPLDCELGAFGCGHVEQHYSAVSNIGNTWMPEE